MRASIALAASLATCSCRTTSNEAFVKLIGGTVAEPGEYPATLNISGPPNQFGQPTNFCTGVFVTPRHILTAAHCVYEYAESLGSGGEVRRKDKLASSVWFFFGPKSEGGYQMQVKATYVPDETVAFLAKNKGWVSNEANPLEFSHDVALIESAADAPEDVWIAELSKKPVKVGTAFRYGGYGCEVNQQIPSTAPVANPGKFAPLKYAQAKVDAVTPLVGFGPKYSGAAKQSACPGDSGGPVYAEPGPEGPGEDGILEVIGVNSFTTIAGPQKREVAFQIVTSGTKLRNWVVQAANGEIPPLKSKKIN